jgi:hypothetical protein
MMNRMPLVFVALALAACGNAGTATDRNRPGAGSGTLQVSGTIEASSSSGMTSFEVDVLDGLGNNVSGATVTIHNQDTGDVPLVETNAGSGRYLNSKAVLSNGDFSLDVKHPKGTISGVVVGNPGMHAVNAPKASTVVAAGVPLQLSWTTPTAAQSASIETRNFPQTLVPDNGAYTIPASGNAANSNQRLDLIRYNTVSIAGGIVGSQLGVTSRVRVVYVVQ